MARNITTNPIPPWSQLPALLQEPAANRWHSFLEAARKARARVPADAAFQACSCRVFAASDFVADTCTRRPQLLTELLDCGELLADSWPQVLGQRVAARIDACHDEHQLKKVLRRVRQREILRIAWRDLAGWAALPETLEDLSELADACIVAALSKLAAWQAAETPAPLGEDGRPAPLLVLAMGKLGAGELNFSSDVDLIFTYPDADSAPQRGALSPEQYFTRLGQALINALSDTDHDGFVFRVDMRLRPYGNAGALACSFEAMEEYYQSQGREWERYAMIKARPLGGDAASRSAITELLRPFVYRRYLDFHAFESLRDLKTQIQREVERKGQQDNIKLGPGGIREIEFVAQAFQLVRGGREPRLRQRGVIEVLDTLAELQLLPRAVVADLLAAYGFLRRVENRLQAIRDQQTHHLPEGELDRARLALAMNYPDWDRFRAALDQHRQRVETHFTQVFAAPAGQPRDSADPLAELWLKRLAEREAERALESAGFDDLAEAKRWIEQLRSGTAPRYLGQQGRARFDALVPMVLAEAGRQPQAAEVLGRLVQVLEHIAGRTTYLVLLQENPPVLAQLVKLCAASPWIAQQIARFPLLLDQLLDPRTLYAPLQHEELESELARRVGDVEAADLEQQMDRLRQFKHAMVLRVAAADLAEAIPLMVVSDRLTAIAEVVVEQVLAIAWAEMVKRYGEPRCTVAGKQRPVAFIVVGYGKLGGIELGYGSDLDLVFLHDSAGSEQKTVGAKPVDNSVFLTRLGQRIIHMLETFTAAGVLYEVDMRLRPSGNSGLLVSSLDAFADYQRSEAWTWEHQALVRARVVAGDPELAGRFAKVREQVLAASRAPATLRNEVRDMRERMRAELGSRGGSGFHLKQDPGGIVDIEFMVQYLVLRWCREHPELLRWTDTIRLLETLAGSGLLEAADAAALIEAYQQYRAVSHRLTLAEASSVIGDDMLKPERRMVAKLWKRLMQS
jgi:glutamate-ammonia-ligase adenylyltransferase